MAVLSLVNPRKRRKAKSATRRKNPVAKRRKAVKRRKNPIAKLSRRTPTKARKYALKGKGRSRRVRRVNPISLKGLKGMAVPAITAAAAAVLVDEITKRVMDKFGASLPAMVKGTWGRLAVEVVIAFTLNMVLEKTKAVKSAQTRQAILMGALTGIGIKAIQDEVLPKITGGLSGYQLIDVNALSGYQSVAAPTSAAPVGLGYMNSAPTAGRMASVRNLRQNRSV